MGCNKQITQAQREQGCLEEVFTILAVSTGSLSYCMPTEAHIIKFVKNYILGNMYVTGLSIYFRQNTP